MKKFFILISFFIAASFLLVACHDDDDDDPSVETETLFVDHYKGSCFGTFGNYQCFRTKADVSSAYTANGCVTEIIDFDYVWGTEYQLEVELLDPLPGEFCGRPKLYSVTSETPATNGVQFSFTVDHWGVGPLVFNLGGGLYRVFEDTEFVCAVASVCSALDLVLAQQASLTLTFSHAAVEGDPLVLQSFVVN